MFSVAISYIPTFFIVNYHGLSLTVMVTNQKDKRKERHGDNKDEKA
jgi:hypothetical protein